LTVDNPQATGGGTDPSNTPQMTEADFDGPGKRARLFVDGAGGGQGQVAVKHRDRGSGHLPGD